MCNYIEEVKRDGAKKLREIISAKAIYIVLSLLNTLRRRDYTRELIIISYIPINLMDSHFENNDVTKI